MGKGSKKGSSFERAICKTLSLWLSKNKKDDIFWRTPGSGARATTRMKKQITTDDSAGDILAISKEGKIFTKNFLIEIKRGYSKQISLFPFIDFSVKVKKKPILFQWWIKAEKERKQHKRKWSIIIFKRDRKETCVFLSKKVFDIFIRLNKQKDIGRVSIFFNQYKFVVLPLNIFLKAVKINQFKRIINKERF